MQLSLLSLPADARYVTVSRGISVRTMPISHGHNPTCGVYDSAAFFIRRDSDASEFLFFGDVEADSVSKQPRNINVWRAAAAKIPETLSAIFIECSWLSGRPTAALFGHLTPEHLVEELEVLATEVVKVRSSVPVTDSRRSNRRASKSTQSSLNGVLAGLRIYVTHCKETWDSPRKKPINHLITDQVCPSAS